MLRNWGTLVLLLLAAPAMAFAQTTGKIAGTVVDAETGEPLPGANVLIEGTTIGAATDIDGEYQIFEVPPGTYTLVASFTGFTTERRTGVEVVSGITNLQNFTLGPSTLELDVIEVTASAPLVNVTATNAVRRMTTEMLQALPTSDAETAYAIQPGVTVLNDEVYIRGGRPDETNFLLEGISSRSIIGFDNVIPVIPAALEEVQVYAGGYSAQFGGANAGIIQQVLRTGGPALSGSVSYTTDGAADAFGTPSYGYNSVTATLGGPLVWQKHRFFGAVRWSNEDNYDPMFWYGANLGLPVDQRESGVAPDTLAWGDDILPGIGRPREQLLINGTLAFDFSPLRLRIGFAQRNQNRRLNDTPIFDFYNTLRQPKRDDMSRLANAQATYFLSDNTYLEANVGLFQYEFDQYDPLFGSPIEDDEGNVLLDLASWYNRDSVFDQVLAARDSATAQTYTKGFTGAYLTPIDYVFNAFPFSQPGDVEDSYRHREQSRYDLGLSLTSQIENHYLVVGGDWSRWTARNYTMSGATIKDKLDEDYIALVKAEDPAVARDVRLFGFGGYGYDAFMNEVDEGVSAAKHPTTAALYVNDRIEYNDIIVNAGLRYDYFDMDLFQPLDAEGNVNPANPQFNEDDGTITGLEKAPAKHVLQPRLGLSFPITERTAFHLQYGKFAQMPDLFFAYASEAFIATVLGGQNFIATPFAWDLDPVRSTQYEIGVGHQFTDFAAFDVTAFYRKSQGQLEIVQQEVEPGASAERYNLFTNGDFAIIRGLELSLRTQRVGGFLGMLNYTLTDAKGTNSEPGGQVSALENNTLPPTLIQPLSFEERHRGSAVLSYATGDEGTPLVSGWQANLLFTFHSGHRFTRSTGTIGQRSAAEAGLLEGTDTRTRIPLESLNASTTPWFFNTDLRVEKGFDFGRATATVFGYVTNLFDTKNVLNVYLRSGTAENDAFLYTPELSEEIIASQGQDYVDYYQAINLDNREHYIFNQGYDIFAEPRQFRLGVRVAF